MDYGKLAYLRADEIEAKLAGLSRRGSESCVYRISSLSEGSHTLLRRGAADGSAVTVKVRYRGKGQIVLSAGGLKAAAESADGSGEKVFFVSGSGDITVDIIPDGGSVGLCADFEIIAPLGCATEEPEAKMSIAHVEEIYALCAAEDGFVTVTRTDSKFSFAENKRVARCCDCDICAADGGFALVFKDGFGMLFCAELDTDLNTVRFSPLGKADGKASVTYRGGRLFVISASDGKVGYFTSPYPHAVKGAAIKIGADVNARKARAVKNCDPIALIAESDDAMYLIKERRGASVGALVNIKLDGGIVNA